MLFLFRSVQFTCAKINHSESAENCSVLEIGLHMGNLDEKAVALPQGVAMTGTYPHVGFHYCPV